MKIRLALSILAIFGQFLPSALGPVAASTVYVGPGGNCGIESPCSETIQYALELSDAEVSLEICQGTYIENLAFPAESTFRKRTFRCQGNITVDGHLTIQNGMIELQSGAFALQDQGLMPVTVPNVVEMEKTAAENDIVAANLAVGQEANRGSDTVAVDHVISQVPVAGVSMAPGNLVDLTVSIGTGGTMEVPFVVGKTKADAYDEISEANLYTGTITEQYSDTTPADQVVNQSPLGGITVEWDVPVDLLISLGPSGDPPPDPADVAPDIDMTVPTAMIAANEFLYTGTDPVQKGVMPGAIEDDRICVIRGKALDSNGDPLSEVKVTVLNRKEYGCTHTRDDGMFDLAVNGGEYLAVSFEKDGFLPSHRQIETLWQNFVWTPDVVLISLDPNISNIDLSAPGMQVAQGSPVADDDGSRQATLLFPEGTEATLEMPDGTEQSVATLNVRATEYTVGPDGPMAMPAELPPTSGYTYAVDFTTDEAIAAGAVHVNFTQPVVGYVENFLDFPTGGAVPVGAYDWQMGRWTPQNDGRIIEILGQTGAMADLDVDGDGVVDTGSALSDLGITDAERESLASLYTIGQSLWRFPIDRFTYPIDCNWPYMPEGGGAPPPDEPEIQDRKEDNSCEKKGQSRIEIQNQVLTESVDVVGTPFTLNYRSDRVSGRTASAGLKIVVTGNGIPQSLKRIELRIEICGRRFAEEFLSPFTPNTIYEFDWDGLDAYGRKVQGKQEATVKIGYIYNSIYMEPALMENLGKSFARLNSSGVEIGRNVSRMEHTFWREWRTDLRESSAGSLGVFETLGQGFGGWTFSVKHDYDPVDRILYRGDGGRRLVAARDRVIDTRVGNGLPEVLFEPMDVAAGPDGSLFVSDQGNQRIRMVSPDGTIATIVGTGIKGYNGDGEALGTWLNYPTGLAPGPGGSYEVTYAEEPGNPPTVTRVWHPLLYFADHGNHRVRKLTRYGEDLFVGTVAGDGTPGYLVPGLGGDGISATYARLNNPSDVALAPDGSLYIADQGNHRIRKVTSDGMIYTVAGNGTAGYNGDEIPAVQARLKSPRAVSVGSDGSLYIADMGNYRVRKVSTDGIITTVAGNGTQGFFGDGGLATDARLANPLDVIAATDGSLYISDSANHRIRQVLPNGIIVTAVGTTMGFGGDGGPAAACQLKYPQGLSFSPEGKILIVDSHNHRVREAWYPQEHFFEELLIASADGGSVFVFSTGGRHLQTLHALTGEVLYSFSYDSEGRLVAVTDAFDNVTTIERDASGDPAAIVAPFGQRTTLGLDANGYLASVANPAGETHSFTYHDDGGLLATHTDPRNNTSEFTYDALGRLTLDEDPAGGHIALVRQVTDDGYEVTTTTAENRSTIYRMERLATGEVHSEIVYPTGAIFESHIENDGSLQASYPDGTAVGLVYGPDPRFGMQTPLLRSATVTTPDGIVNAMSFDRSVTLADPSDPLGIVTLEDTVVANGRTYTYTFDAASLSQTSTPPDGCATTTTLNVQGNVMQIDFMSGLDSILLQYDASGRLASAARGNQSWTYAYNGSTRPASRIDAAGNETGYAYDNADRLTRMTLPSEGDLSYQYDANGNRMGIIMPEGMAHALGYSSRDLLESYVPPGNPGYALTYNLDKNVVAKTLPGGRTITNTFDTGGRWTGVAYAEAQVEFCYDDNTGRLAGLVRDPTAGSLDQEVHYGYDGGLVVETTFNGVANGEYEYTYDENFFVLASDFQSGTDSVNRSFSRDVNGRAIGDGTFTYSRSGPCGAVSQINDGAMSMNLSYDGLARIQSKSLIVNGVDVYDYSVSRDNTGAITEKVETVAGSSHEYEYAYDEDGQLVEVKRDDTVIESYAYDANGNRISTISEAAGYDDQDRIDYQGSVDYQFDADGFMELRGGASFQYSARGELLEVALEGGATVSYAYDGLKRMVGRVDGNGTNQYMYGNPGNLFLITEARDPSGVLTAFFYDESGLLFALEREATRYYVAVDPAGTPMVVADASGSAVKVMQRDAFGKLVSDSNPAFYLPIGFAGGLEDSASGLVRFGYRDYDLSSGRWTARDPVLYDGGQANLYVYVGNDPVNLRDPLGLWCFGGSFFAVVGGGAEVCCFEGACSVCAEGGIGVGGSAGIGTGKAKETGNYIAEEVGASCYGMLGAAAKCAYDFKCPWKCDFAGSAGPVQLDTSKEVAWDLVWKPEGKCSAQGKIALQGCGKLNF